MKIVYALEDFSDCDVPVFLAAGCFDGLHKGHQAVIQVAIDRAKDCSGEVWVYTFDEHPAKVLSPEHAPPMIFSQQQQLRHLQDMGVDGCILQSCTPEFMRLKPMDFFEKLCSAIPSLQGISVGEDWSFGRGRSGNIVMLSAFCQEKGIHFSAHEAVCWHGERISSMRIREAIRMGNLDSAYKMLGEHVSTIGRVVGGNKIGRTLGYPTANIEPENEMLPPCGIYAAILYVGKTRYKAAAYIGHRGTFFENEPQALEVHLLDTHGIDLYGEVVELYYLKYIRGDIVFKNVDLLKKQINHDVNTIQAYLE